MQYLNDDSEICGEEEACPDCGRPMLASPFITGDYTPANYVMCRPKRVP